MAITTGDTQLPNPAGMVLEYNGVAFNSLFKSKMSGADVMDDAKRAKKYTEWTLDASGYVTIVGKAADTYATMQQMRILLSQPGGQLFYNGRGFGPFSINAGLAQSADVAWGPIPEILTFQPLGQGRGAFCEWRCISRIPDIGPLGPTPVIQFNYECGLSYDEEGYASITIRGVLEIPLARLPGSAGGRAIQQTVDDFRKKWESISFDLTKYKVVDRHFNTSRDQRTSEWSYDVKELSPAGLPVGHTGARGKVSVRPLRPGGGPKGLPLALPRWVCTMNCTYTVRADFPRRMAFFAFMSLLWYRMWSAVNGVIPDLPNDTIKQAAANALTNAIGGVLPTTLPTNSEGARKFYVQLSNIQQQAGSAALAAATNKGANPANLAALPLLMDFGVDEGLYEDAKQITFQASWVVTTTFQTLIQATGIWNYSPDVGGDFWALSVQDVSGWRSCLAARIDPLVEVIVDMGGGAPLTGSPIKKE